ncbi:histone-like nucleoid-structuring protein Lsr2 [Williamsia sp. SKLECPSW1]
MARRHLTQVVDDLDGLPLQEFQTIRWSLDDTHYEFDTSPANARAFRSTITRHLAVSRKVADRVASTVEPSSDAGTVRRWARDNGVPVGARGRLPSAVVDAYHAARSG